MSAKICGLTTEEAVQSAVAHGAAFLGFVFFPRSPRHLSFEQAQVLAVNIPNTVKKVAVVVDPSDEDLAAIRDHLAPDYLQLHGSETVARAQEIKGTFGVPIIKACAIRSADDVAAAQAYTEVAEMLLFDAKAPTSMSGALPGGNGVAFDWTILQEREFPVPWLLSGGLHAGNAAEAVQKTGAKMVDVSSGVERAPGVKDPQLIKEFLEAVAAIG